MVAAIGKRDLSKLQAWAEECFPEEACALLCGWRSGRTIAVQSVHLATNVASDPRRLFEVDPQLILQLQKDIRIGSGEFDIVGVFHSHPTGSAKPSETDLARARAEKHIWLIAAMVDGCAVETRAHELTRTGDRFEEIELQIN